MRTKYIKISLSITLFLTTSLYAGGPVGIDWGNDSGLIGNFGRLYQDAAGTLPLSAGTPTALGDGFLIQLVALQGGTNYVLASASIGDSPAALIGFGNGADGDGTNGYFALSSNISSGMLAGAVSSPLGVKFYNASTIGAATAYGVVSNLSIFVPSPNYATPPNVTVFELDALLGSGYLGPRTIGNTGFYTDTLIVIPEPSTLFLVGMGVAGAWFVRRRKKA